ncbi:hypothetical protein [Allosphingosinicella indica]|uniref:YhhN-like protein n=1 Tax=Allosphingosinicella indica TaxID=941907 RepID=A0A1X7FZT8_9SPHN|nr:hypothetical protein [Allosphingosinicella indica]SMF61063.1 hypothetical protein SAMN06295910_0105 [Allosphingosinicella indica]
MVIFLVLLLACCGYALARGAREERAAALIMFTGCVATWAVNSPLATRYAAVEPAILAVDLAMFALFVAVALRSERYWPLWLSALQLLAVLAHGARFADPDMMRNGYGFVMAVWSYPQLVLIAIVTRIGRKRPVF